MELAARTYNEDAYERLEHMLKAKVSAFPDITKSLPPSPATAPLSSSTRLTKTTARKIQTAITRAVQMVSHKLLRADTHPDRIQPHFLTKASSCLITSRSQQSLMLVGSMWFKSNRVESDAFVHYSHFYLGLLPLLRPACEVLVAPDGTKRSICAGGHDTLFFF